MPTKRLNKSGTDKKRNYTDREMIEALTVFKKCDCNYQRTINITGISRNTLKKWVKEHPEVLNDNRTDSTIRKVESVVAQKEESLITKYYNNQSEILDICYKRLREILPNCASPMVLLEVVKVFNPITETNAGKEKAESSTIVAETIQRLTIATKKIENTN